MDVLLCRLGGIFREGAEVGDRGVGINQQDIGGAAGLELLQLGDHLVGHAEQGGGVVLDPVGQLDDLRLIENDVVIGTRVRIQTGAYITAFTEIEDDVFVAPMVVTANDRTTALWSR